MNARYGIINMQILIKSNEQLNGFLLKNYSEISALMKSSILSNYIPYETITCDHREPPWINNKIKQLIQEINNTYRIYILSNKNPQIFEKVNYLQNQLKLLTESNKERYYLRISKKLMDPMTSAKTYWSILKSLLNKKKILAYLLFFIRIKRN